MKATIEDIEELTVLKASLRRVIFPGKDLEMVLVVLKAGEEIGAETHTGQIQFFRVAKGKGKVWIDGDLTKIKRDDAIIVPAGASHTIVNTGSKSLKLHTLYGTPQQNHGIISAPRADTLAAKENMGEQTSAGPADSRSKSRHRSNEKLAIDAISYFF
jgi:mannose-6-phosphate isomerase-like protein (cupin superfamily)